MPGAGARRLVDFSHRACLRPTRAGGDWALARSGAVLLEGTELATVSHCLFERIDGNGIFLSNWNRNATLARNELAWVGGTAMASGPRRCPWTHA